jgi:hypothetical protein
MLIEHLDDGSITSALRMVSAGNKSQRRSADSIYLSFAQRPCSDHDESVDSRIAISATEEVLLTHSDPVSLIGCDSHENVSLVSLGKEKETVV